MLDGFVVGITADRRWEEQAELLRRRGADVLHGPTIRTLPLGPEEGLQLATERLIADPPPVLIANTGIGMRAWFAAADSWGMGEALYDALATSRIYARGPKASATVHQAGLDVVARAPSERLDELVELLIASEALSGVRVAFQRHGEDAPDTLKALAAEGAIVEEIPVYNWTLPDDPKPALRLVEATIGRRVHALTFTSAPAVRNLLELADEHGQAEDLLDALNTDVIAGCVGPVCGGAAADLGIADPLVPERARLGPLIRLVSDQLEGRAQHIVVAGRAVTLRGTLVLDGDRRVELTDREAGVLALLARRPRIVVTKQEMLRLIWRSAASDPHVVEVTVARLRRRLGELGPAVVAVPRRGYLLDAR